MIDWLSQNQNTLLWVGGASALTFVATLIAIPILVARIPADYFLHPEPRPESWRARHHLIHVTLVVAKNVLGVLLILTGLVLSLPLVPGQGILTILIGLFLLDFPGKRRLELRLVRQRPVLNAINWIRSRAGRPPLQVAPDT